jgi:hypothetical protein
MNTTKKWLVSALVAALGLGAMNFASADTHRPGYRHTVSRGWHGDRYWDGHRYWARKEWERRHHPRPHHY